MVEKERKGFLITDVKSCTEGFNPKWSNTLVYEVPTEQGDRLFLEMTIDVVKKFRTMPERLPPWLGRLGNRLRASGSPPATHRSQNPDTMAVSGVPARPACVSHADSSAKKASFMLRLYSLKVRAGTEPVYGGARCPLLAQSGHSTTEFQYPFLGVKRTLRPTAHTR